MTHPPPHDLTRMLEAISAGQDQAADRLLSVVYGELRALARARMAREKPGQTLQPTALVHEAYLRLFAGEHPRWENRAHFFGAAAEAMRRILIERARRHARLKRGGGREQAPLTEIAAEGTLGPEELLALDEALERLQAKDTEMARVVKLRYFAGLTVEETAEALGPRASHRQSAVDRRTRVAATRADGWWTLARLED